MEWENVTRTGDHRAEMMLTSISRQVAQMRGYFAHTPELIAVFDVDEIEMAVVETTLRQHIDPASGLALKLLPVRGLDYFEQKNRGVDAASADWVILADCDIIPAAGWLAALLSAALATDGRALIAGTTSIDTATLQGRAFACFWYFPKPSCSDAVVTVRDFQANNFIVARALFQHYQFYSDRTILSRAAVLAARLHADGIPLLRAQAARALHPAPRGWHGLIQRALIEGHDACTDPLNQQHRVRVALRWAPRLARNWARVMARTVRHRRTTGMAWTELPAAIAIGLAYYGVVAIGEIAALNQGRTARLP